MLKIESVGKNLEQAIEAGLAELKVSRQDVEIKIIDKGGLFKKAKVVLIVDEEVEKNLTSREDKIKQMEKELEEANKAKEAEVIAKAEKVVEAKKEEKPLIEEQDASTYSDMAKAITEFIKGYAQIQNVDVKFYVTENLDDIQIDINGENSNKLIGYRGEALNALQYICNIYASKLDKKSPRIYLNVGNFKEEREQHLIKLARKLASKVAKTKQSFKLEPMNAYERKIVHKALQNDSFVETYSVGEEPRRCLVIDVKGNREKEARRKLGIEDFVASVEGKSETAELTEATDVTTTVTDSEN